MAPVRLSRKAKLQDNDVFHDDESKKSRRSQKRKIAPPIPAYERGGVRSFDADQKTPPNPLPTVSATGEVKRVPRKFNVVRKSKPQVTQPDPSGASEPASDEQTNLAPAPRKRRKKERRVEEKAVPFSAIRVRLSGWASKVVSAPEANVSVLRELRQFSTTHKGRAAALAILTEAQLFKDIAPAYRIRKITEKEAAVKVSKEIAKLRAFEQALLSAYVSYVRSICTLSRWNAGSAASSSKPLSKATDQMHRVRRAACTALAELLRALPHFNQADSLVSAVCALTADRDEQVRKEAAGALRSVLSQAHRAAGSTLATCVGIGNVLSKAACGRASTVSAETMEPLLGIKFASFPLLPVGKADNRKKGHFKGKHQKVNQRNAAKAAKEESAKAQFNRETETDVQRDLREADAEATPHELHSARKTLLDAVCRALFNVVHSASKSAAASNEAGETNGRTKKPPPALAAALHGLLRVAEYISIDIVEAILAALGPLLDSQRLPLSTRLRCLSAAYAILAHHARVTGATEDSVTADARGVDKSLYAALDALFGAGTPMSAAESCTGEFTRAIGAAVAFREMPPARAAAFARRATISAAALAPTQAATLALLAAVQFVAPRRLVSCIYAGASGSVSGEGELLIPYDCSIEDPDASAAQNSAMWELAALVRHFHPSTRAIANAIAKANVEPALVTSVAHVPALVKQYSSEGGGFNPAPQTEWKGSLPKTKRNRRTSEKQLLQSMGIREEDIAVSEEIELDVVEGHFSTSA